MYISDSQKSMSWIATHLVQNEFITQINGISITIKREDKLHPLVSGNKFRKLKYNFAHYKQDQCKAALLLLAEPFQII